MQFGINELHVLMRSLLLAIKYFKNQMVTL